MDGCDATVEIRKQAFEAVPVETLFEAAGVSSQYLETQYEIFQSSSLAREAIRNLDLTSHREFAVPPEESLGSGSMIDPLKRVMGPLALMIGRTPTDS